MGTKTIIRIIVTAWLISVIAGCNSRPTDNIYKYKGLKHPAKNNGFIKNNFFIDNIFNYKIRLPEGWKLIEDDDFKEVAVEQDETFLFGIKRGENHIYAYDFYLRSDTYASFYNKCKNTADKGMLNFPATANTFAKASYIPHSYGCFDEIRYNCYAKNDNKFLSRFSWLLFDKYNKHVIVLNQLADSNAMVGLNTMYESICKN